MKKLMFLMVSAMFLSFSASAQGNEAGKQLEMRMKKIATALNDAGMPLRDTQHMKLKESLASTMKKMNAARGKAMKPDRAAMKQIRVEGEKEVRGILTAEQFDVFTQVQNARGSRSGGVGAPGKGKGSIGDAPTSQPKTGGVKPAKEMKKVEDEVEMQVEEVKEEPRGQEHLPKNRKVEDDKPVNSGKAKANANKGKEKSTKKENRPNSGKGKAEKMKQGGLRAASMAGVDRISSLLAKANMPMTDTQGKELKSILMREQKKIGALVEKSGEGSKDYVKGLKKIKKGSVKRMKNIFSPEQFKFIKKKWK